MAVVVVEFLNVISQMSPEEYEVTTLEGYYILDYTHNKHIFYILGHYTKFLLDC